MLIWKLPWHPFSGSLPTHHHHQPLQVPVHSQTRPHFPPNSYASAWHEVVLWKKFIISQSANQMSGSSVLLQQHSWKVCCLGMSILGEAIQSKANADILNFKSPRKVHFFVTRWRTFLESMLISHAVISRLIRHQVSHFRFWITLKNNNTSLEPMEEQLL